MAGKGGRKAGVPNRSTVEATLLAQRGVAEAKKKGILPLDLLMHVVRDEPWAAKYSDRQIDCAKAALPYVHPRLVAVAVKQEPDAPPMDLSVFTDTELQQFMRLLRRATQARAAATATVIEGEVLESRNE